MAGKDVQRQCHTCRYYDGPRRTDAGVYSCRRHAPTPTGPGQCGVWPGVLPTHWCGDWEFMDGHHDQADVTLDPVPAWRRSVRFYRESSDTPRDITSTEWWRKDE